MKLYSDEELADILDQDIFHLIGDVADSLGVECYVVGGYVRDIFLERPSNDIDVVVVGSGIEVATALKRRLGRRAHLSVFRNFGTAQVKIHNSGERRVESGERNDSSVECRVESGEFATAPESVECRVESGEFATAPESVECRVESGEFATALPSSGTGTPVGNSKLYTLNSTLKNGTPVGNSKLYTLNSKLNNSPLEVEFVGARRESYSHDSRKPIVENGTLEDDQNRRDFTINAMAICLNGSRFGELVDPFNGLADLQDGIIATPLDPDITFSDDPLRMMRCIRFATQLGFRIEDETFEALERMADRIKIVSGERIMTELNKIILAPHPSVGFVDLQRAGLLPIILPELAALDIVEQRGGRAHKNNFYHTLEVLENVAARIENGELGMENYDYQASATTSGIENGELGMENYDYQASAATPVVPGVQGNHNSPFSILNSQLYLRWAALLHDIGKTKTKRWEPSVGWTFHNHNIVGANMVPQIFRRLKLPMGAEMKYVQKLVDLHMRPQVIADEEVTDSAVRRLLNDAGDDIDDLMTLCEADITSKNEVKKKIFLENFRMVREKIADLKVKDYKRLLQPVIDGNEIMEMFQLKPSREVGVLKQFLKDAVLDSRVENEREPLIRLLLQKAEEMGLVPVK